MPGLLATIGLGLAGFAYLLFQNADTAFHELVGGSFGIAAAIFLTGAAIVRAIEGIPERQRGHDVALKRHIKDLQEKEVRKAQAGPR